MVDFFFPTSFDDFEFDRCFLKRLLGQVLGKAFWGHPGASWGAWEGILGGPGGSRGRLGRVLGGLGAILERPFEQSDFGSIF